jgi:4-hydroxy-2-oxoheptanedioate aldolase
MIPMIETSGEAKDAVAACRYPPRGKRGWEAAVARASLYGLDYDYTLQTAFLSCWL